MNGHDLILIFAAVCIFGMLAATSRSLGASIGASVSGASMSTAAGVLSGMLLYIRHGVGSSQEISPLLAYTIVTVVMIFTALVTYGFFFVPKSVKEDPDSKQ